jgi:NDP-sugar pyrophosphorylase family protein
MKTILLALGRRLGTGGVQVTIPAELLPIAGRPLIQRYVEYLSDSGRKDIAVVLRDEPERFSTFLEEGERWGASISYHRCPTGTDHVSFAESLSTELGADEVFDPLAPPPPGRGDGSWNFPGALDLVAYLDCVALTLGGKVPGFVPSGRETAQGLRLSHHVRIHPSARLIPPLFIGEGAEIGAGAEIGPFASVERGSVIGAGTYFAHSVALPWTLIGEKLHIEEAVVEGSAFFKPRSDAVYIAEDPALSTTRTR